ncbi:MAG: glycine oxidase ThiO [Candidatus Acidiferrales bacterium]
MTSSDVIIIGGGIIGLSLAHKLANENLSVVVLDRRQPGLEASWAAAGMLCPGPESPDDVALVPLAKKSLELYPEFVCAIEEASGARANFRRDGTLELFFGTTAEAVRDRSVAGHREHDLGTQAISADDARAIESALSDTAFAAAWLPHECSVEPRALTSAVLQAAKKCGAEVRANVEVRKLLIEGSRCAGVETQSEKFTAKHIILAAGCFSSAIGAAARIAPTRPVRGQMLSLRAARPIPNHVVRSHSGYVVPRGNGLLVAGSTIEHVGYEKGVTAAGISGILAAAIELIPELAGAAIEETWSGLRPDTPDHLPLIGSTEIDGLWLATGHYRNGILLAPATAQILGNWILQGKPDFNVEAYSPHRFTSEKSTAAS